MDNRRLLLPINVNRCRPGVFEIVNQFARKSEVTAILLHVVTLNVTAAENRVYEGLVQEAESYLEKLTAQYIDPVVITTRRVRIGKASEEILAAAECEHPDVILMTVDRKSLQDNSVLERLRSSTASLSRTVNAVLKRAPCDVLVLPTLGKFNCVEAWGRPGNDARRHERRADRAGKLSARPVAHWRTLLGLKAR